MFEGISRAVNANSNMPIGGNEQTIEVIETALKVTPYDQYISKQEILESCIDTKGQQVVSLSRLAEVLGVDKLSKEEIAKIVEDRKR